MKRKIAGLLILALAATAAFGISASANPQNGQRKNWAKNHPRQHQVLKRTRNEKRRANRLYKQGKITKQQRNQIDHQANQVRREDRTDSRTNGGYISKGQQGSMNGQENGINNEINQDRRQDAGQGGPGGGPGGPGAGMGGPGGGPGAGSPPPQNPGQ